MLMSLALGFRVMHDLAKIPRLRSSMCTFCTIEYLTSVFKASDVLARSAATLITGVLLEKSRSTSCPKTGRVNVSTPLPKKLNKINLKKQGYQKPQIRTCECETTDKGTGFAETAGKEDLIEFDFRIYKQKKLLKN